MLDDVPHIQAECSMCSMIFDLKWGLDCPRCHSTGVKWARLAEQEYRSRNASALKPPCKVCGGATYIGDMPCETCNTAEQQAFESTAQNLLRGALDAYIEEQGAAKEVAWLEKLYSL